MIPDDEVTTEEEFVETPPVEEPPPAEPVVAQEAASIWKCAMSDEGKKDSISGVPFLGKSLDLCCAEVDALVQIGLKVVKDCQYTSVNPAALKSLASNIWSRTNSNSDEALTSISQKLK
jgi:hypothetical protein